MILEVPPTPCYSYSYQNKSNLSYVPSHSALLSLLRELSRRLPISRKESSLSRYIRLQALLHEDSVAEGCLNEDDRLLVQIVDAQILIDHLVGLALLRGELRDEGKRDDHDTYEKDAQDGSRETDHAPDVSRRI